MSEVLDPQLFASALAGLAREAYIVSEMVRLAHERGGSLCIEGVAAAIEVYEKLDALARQVGAKFPLLSGAPKEFPA
ncbi:unnamed protein product [marine sediment metagenome]|uniref:Uncharacterized protein n=1 Tax=marine sediment metagenome TaxID=412755 RepID=X0RFY1_9ZZZZ